MTLCQINEILKTRNDFLPASNVDLKVQ